MNTRASTFNLWRVVAFVFFVWTLLATLVPFLPDMPHGDLESSWIFALNQAQATGLRFGKDIVFTFGPYAAIYTRVFHPGTDSLAICGSLLLVTGYGVIMFLLMRAVSARWLLILGLVFATARGEQDPLLFLYAALAALAAYRFCLPEHDPWRLGAASWETWALTLALMPLGLLPLIKGSLLFACLPVMFLSMGLLVMRGRYLQAVIYGLAPAGGMVLMWLLSGQRLEDLPLYLRNMLDVAAGYTEAMALTGDGRDILLYLAGCISVAYVIAIQRTPRLERLFLFTALSLVLFLSFKAGFVRHDGHVVRSAVALAFVAFALPFAACGWRVQVAQLVAIVCVVMIWNDHGSVRDSLKPKAIAAPYRSMYQGLVTRFEYRGSLAARFDEQLKLLAHETPLPKLPGTSDLYPTDLSYLIASGNRWSPRPVMQSYTAYTPLLDRMNEAHLSGPTAPDHVFFKVDPIDGRLPAMDDSLSWPTLFFSYAPIGIDSGYLVLKKLTPPHSGPTTKVMDLGAHKLNEVVKVPDVRGLVMAQVKLKQSWLGRLRSLIYKPPTLMINLTLVDGEIRQYRIVSSIAEAGFVLSPLVSSTYEFAMAYGDNSALDGTRVRDFSISSPDDRGHYWNESFTVKVSEIENKPVRDVGGIVHFDGVTSDELSRAPMTSGACMGNIDGLNDLPVSAAEEHVGHIMHLRGWLARNVQEGLVPPVVFVTLTNAQGQRTLVHARRTPRPDVGNYFGKPGLDETGFDSFADIRAVPDGKYMLGLAYSMDGALFSCDQIQIPVIKGF